MSFRPSIAVFARGRIADWKYCRNWDERDLFFHALYIALTYRDCRTIEEYRQKRYGCQKIYYTISPVVFENTQKNLKELLSHSEFPVAVDLTAGCIYVSECPLFGKQLKRLPSVFDPKQKARVDRILDRQDYYILLYRFRIPFRELDREALLKMLKEICPHSN